MHLVGFIIRIYHDARSSECQIRARKFSVHAEMKVSKHSSVVLFTDCFIRLWHLQGGRFGSDKDIETIMCTPRIFQWGGADSNTIYNLYVILKIIL